MSSRPSSFTLTTPGSLRLFSTQELLNRPVPPWFIEGIFPSGGFVSLFGPPKCGKSFLAMDMALSAATGRAWQGRTVQGGKVLYIAAEGGPGIGKRARAWLTHHRVNAQSLNLFWLTEPMLMFRESADIDRLAERLDDELETKPSFIVVDTLARCFEGNENEQEAMNAFVAGCDQLRNTYGSTVLVVHHTRLDGERERGNTAFRGALDTLVGVKPMKGLIEVSCAAQKDAEEFGDFYLKLQPIPGTDSCVTVAEDFDPGTYEFLRTLRENAESQPWSMAELVALMDGVSGWSKSTTVRRIRDTVKSKDLLNKNGEYLLAVSRV